MDKGLVCKGYTLDEKGTTPSKITPTITNEFYKFKLGEEILDPPLWSRVAGIYRTAKGGNPRFHIWAERPPLTKSRSKATLQVVNKKPIDVINHLAVTEEIPIDFYASHVNGDFIFGPRLIDFSGFEDVQRSFRTYFFKGYPKSIECEPAFNQKVLEIKTLNTTIGTYNQFIILDSSQNNRTASFAEQTEIFFEQLPYTLLNRGVTPPCRTQIISDGSLSTYSDPEAGAALIGFNAARRWARDINGVQITVIGDPTWFPSEGFQVYNTGLHDFDTLYTEDSIKDEAVYREIVSELEQAGEQIISQQEANRFATPAILATKVAEYFDPSKGNTKRNKFISNLDALILPKYKARQIQHVISGGANKGYKTVIQGVVD